jgi:plasmid stabilization system protein ParE
MIYGLKYSAKAQADFIKAFNYYEDQLIGLGGRFEDCIDQKIIKIINNPYAYPGKRAGLRECWAKDFPFLIVYSISERSKLIVIASIFHTSRNPRKKYKK